MSDKLDEVKKLVNNIDEFINTGTCKFNNGTCCGCPGDENPEDMAGCYKYALEQILIKLNSIVES